MKKATIRQLNEGLFYGICLLATLLPLLILACLLADTVVTGIGRLNWDFLVSYPSRFAEKAGIFPALMGSLFLIVLTAVIALPLGVACAIFLEEYAANHFYAKLVEVNMANLAGVPSVIFGLLGLEVFVRLFGFGHSLLAGACTLALLALPVVVTASREAIRGVPIYLREAGYSLGASKLMVVRKIVLPLALPQITTGAILAISRAAGESAPLIVIGAATYLAFIPNSIFSEFSALPLQIFHWVERPKPGFAENAAAAIVVLLIVLTIFNACAAWIRHKYEGFGRR